MYEDGSLNVRVVDTTEYQSPTDFVKRENMVEELVEFFDLNIDLEKIDNPEKVAKEVGQELYDGDSIDIEAISDITREYWNGSSRYSSVQGYLVKERSGGSFKIHAIAKVEKDLETHAA